MKAVIDGVEYEIAVTDDPGSAYAGTNVKDLTPTSQNWSFCGSYIYNNSYYYLTSGVYYIDENVTITRPLMVAQGNTVTLNLNGNTLIGNSGDSVIVVAGGTLTVNDGTITGGQGNLEIRHGGYSRGGGLAVDFYSNVTLNDVVITGNRADFGGGIFIHGPGNYSGDPAFVTLNRCTVTGNSGDGAGVFFDGGNLTVNDSVIRGNTGWGLRVGAQCDGVFLKGDSVIYGNTNGDVHIGGDVGAYGSLQGVSVVGELGPNAKIGINMEHPNVFTNSETTAYNDPSKFVSNSNDWISVKNTAGQLMLVEASKVKVTTTDYTGPYDGNEHTIDYTVKDGDEAASLRFGTEEGTYNLTEPPKFTDCGVHPVYYQIDIETAGGTYVPIIGGATVNIQAVVSFAHGEGSGDMASVSVDAGSLYTLPESGFIAPENVVGEFGWRSGADNGIYAPGAKVKVYSNTTFTAEWVTGKVASFVAGGGSGDAPADIVKLPGAVIKLPRNTFTAPSVDRLFGGWSADGTTLYYPGDKYTLDEDVTFTAQWIEGEVASFDGNGGSGDAPESIVRVPGEQIKLPANTFTAPEGKIFFGWTVGTDSYAVGDSYTLTEDVTFKAVWVDGYLIPDHGDKTVKLTGKVAGYSFKVYDFAGPDVDFGRDWDGTLTIVPPAGLALEITGNVEITDYYIDGFYIYGCNENNELQSFDIPGTVSLQTADNPVILRLKTNSYGEYAPGVDLSVKVIEPDYTVTYDANGGSGTMPDGAALEGKPTILPACGFTPPTGKAFNGWLSGADGQTYQPGQSVPLTGNTTFTARWTDGAKVTFDSNGGSAVDPQYARYTVPEGVLDENGRMEAFNNDLVIRYLDRVVVKDDGYEVIFKAGVTVEVEV